MASVNIKRNHNLNKDELKSKIESLKDQIEKDYKVKSSWKDDNTMSISGTGIKKGSLNFDDSSINIDIKLGMLASALKGKIESGINKKLDELLK
ncbi:MAG: polyhydroxyalkanoic acid system family protein [Deltaproteobacteria bacterium]|jgi:putative polyhydroxyalkanoate system protein|nr:polyhydroxyalkanoic acid system family protein [Deltaproteobacteria bacterium]